MLFASHVKVSLIVIWSVLVIHSGVLIYVYTCSPSSVSQLQWCYIVIITLLETADIYRHIHLCRHIQFVHVTKVDFFHHVEVRELQVFSCVITFLILSVWDLGPDTLAPLQLVFSDLFLSCLI